MQTLQRGSSGADVVLLQQKLLDKGFNPGTLDGSFGGGTEAALLAFQRSEGLLADGVAGPRTLRALGFDQAGPAPDITGNVTLEMVSRMFPATPVRNISANLPSVLRALGNASLADKPMVLMALATIRAEVECFQPIDEGVSRFNTSPGGAPFDLYDSRKDLGNLGAPDGASFRGRGFIQLTGRANYQAHGRAIGLGDQLISQPELANDPDIASRLLASFLGSREVAIKQALLEHDLAQARRLVNGGSHGLDRFTEAYQLGTGLIPDQVALGASA
jgi:peptidoglycan L-alanyl-D-glutamate endopeptidase CwlK